WARAPLARLEAARGSDLRRDDSIQRNARLCENRDGKHGLLRRTANRQDAFAQAAARDDSGEGGDGQVQREFALARLAGCWAKALLRVPMVSGFCASLPLRK